MMRYGIPAYRLPRDVLDAEIDRIAALGVRIDLRPPGRGPRRRAATRAASTRSSSRSARTCRKRVDIPARDAGRIVDAVVVPARASPPASAPVIGRRVAVYGGGNTAMDAARVARRLGADEAIIVYRRTREQMPAHDDEAEDAEREGVRINWLRTITAFDGPRAAPSRSWSSTSTGCPQPTGRFETLEADTVILALGQETDTGFLRARARRRVRATTAPCRSSDAR